MVRVSHDEARVYAARLGRREAGPMYRLPTESEWEYSCRAGTKSTRWWGDDAARAQGRASVLDSVTREQFGIAWEPFEFDDGHRVSAPVGTFEPNGWGLYDMLGNVWEWCSDWKEGRLAEPTQVSPVPVHDPHGPTSGDRRVLRGGSWYDSPRDIRSANRAAAEPGSHDDYNGFRLVLVPPPK